MGRRAGLGKVGPTLAHSGADWGEPPWEVDFVPRPRPLPAEVDFAIIGSGFTGLAVACWLRRLAPERNLVVLEAGRLGAGASGRTGGVALDETAGGPLLGLGQVLAGFTDALAELGIQCDLQPTDVWEISRGQGQRDSPMAWEDSGILQIAEQVPGAMLNPGRLLSGLGSVAQARGASLHEHTPVRGIDFQNQLRLELQAGELRAGQVVLAVNGSGLGFEPHPEALAPSGWPLSAQAKFTLAVATAPLTDDQLRALSPEPLPPFYTLDLPYLWGRPLPGNRLLFGGGLVHLQSAEQLAGMNVAEGEPARLLAGLQARVRGLVPPLHSLEFTHRWGGPILFVPGGRPIFCHHPESQRVLVLGGYSGQGIALSVHLARWAAEALLGRRTLPDWGRPEE